MKINISEKSILVLFSLPFILIGLLVVIGITRTLYDMYDVTVNWVETEGQVIEIRTRYETTGSRRSSQSIRHYPLIEYNVEGETYKFMGDRDIASERSTGQNPPITYVPESDYFETILYNPDDVNEATMKYTIWQWVGLIISVIVFGFMFVGSGLLIFTFSLLKKND